jgi:hypothetical protein
VARRKAEMEMQLRENRMREDQDVVEDYIDDEL